MFNFCVPWKICLIWIDISFSFPAAALPPRSTYTRSCSLCVTSSWFPEKQWLLHQLLLFPVNWLTHNFGRWKILSRTCFHQILKYFISCAEQLTQWLWSLDQHQDFSYNFCDPRDFDLWDIGRDSRELWPLRHLIILWSKDEEDAKPFRKLLGKATL